ncbi:unnamed protein product [Ambrosiozyma monospora]|uniref:Unnamed protein product n=1 Tax=Ambrosiozyma monospora TaxID=43982 RepID=A0A9W6Z2Z0_AMBMO|nr:unnamed protein product [Ambrosiozyma monospora]
MNWMIDDDSDFEIDEDTASHNRRVKKSADAEVISTKSGQNEKRTVATVGDDVQDYEENDSEEEEYAVEIHKIGDISKKLDSIMSLLLTTSTTTSSPFMPSTSMLDEDETQPIPDLDTSIATFTTLLPLFQSHILPTHNTRCVQYLIFHVAQQHPELTESFLYKLIDIAFSFNQLTTHRIKAVQYLSSFIARAKSLPRDQLIQVVNYLTTWCSKFVLEREWEIDPTPIPTPVSTYNNSRSNSRNDARRHGHRLHNSTRTVSQSGITQSQLRGQNQGSGSTTGGVRGGMERFKMLYCVFQCLLYIFCFRYKELKADYVDPSTATGSNNVTNSSSNTGRSTGSNKIEGEEWVLKLDKFFNSMVMSKFNPLKFCNETVVLIFARLAQQLDLCYCFTIIERNKRERLNGVSSVSHQNGPGNGSDGGENTSGRGFEHKQEFLDLEAYFPFDPLILKKSKRIVELNYIQWESFDDDEEEEEEEDEDDDDD